MFTPEDFSIPKKINNNLTMHLFKWYEVGVLGVGPKSKPCLDLSGYFSDAPYEKMDAELTNIFANRADLHTNVIPGHGCIIPTDVNNKKWLNYFIYRAEEYIPAEVRARAKTRFEIIDWVYKNLAEPDWSDRLLISMNLNNTASWQAKHTNGTIHDEFKLAAPVFTSWLANSLTHVFKDIGRVIVFRNLKNVPVGIHRDYFVQGNEQQLHCINFQLGRLDRPFFIYDEVTKERFYANGMRAYTFNDLDCHGVDAEDYDAYTVRVDGVFTDKFCQEQGFVNGATWGPYSASYSKLANLKIYEPEQHS